MLSIIHKRLMSTIAQEGSRVALVTGAGSGIGRAVCHLLAKESTPTSFHVIASDINGKSAQATIDQLSSLSAGQPFHHLAVQADVSKRYQVEEMFKKILDTFQLPPSVIVNCAGITRDKQLSGMTEELFDEVMNVNVKGTLWPIQIGCKLMIESKVTEGSIVNVSSISGKNGNFGQSNYSASKAAIIGLTKTVAKEMAKHNIRCNAVIPGFIDTPMVESVPEKIQMVMNMLIPLARKGNPEEVAEAILFLASSKSSYITGATIDVTGGLFM